MEVKNNTKRAIGTFLLHAIAGPPIGACLFLLAIMIYQITVSGHFPPDFGGVFLLAMPFSYAIGGGFALATGLVLAFVIYKKGYYSYLTALLVTLCVLPPVAVIKIYGFRLFHYPEVAPVFFTWVLPSVASTLICRWLLFLRTKTPEPAQIQSADMGGKQ